MQKNYSFVCLFTDLFKMFSKWPLSFLCYVPCVTNKLLYEIKFCRECYCNFPSAKWCLYNLWSTVMKFSIIIFLHYRRRKRRSSSGSQSPSRSPSRKRLVFATHFLVHSWIIHFFPVWRREKPVDVPLFRKILRIIILAT